MENADVYLNEVDRRGGTLPDRDARREVSILAWGTPTGANGPMYGGTQPSMRTLPDGSSVRA
jgi:hypothetical protein